MMPAMDTNARIGKATTMPNATPALTPTPATLDAAMPIALTLNAYLNAIDERIALVNNSTPADDETPHFADAENRLRDRVAGLAQQLSYFGFPVRLLDALNEERVNAL